MSQRDLYRIAIIPDNINNFLLQYFVDFIIHALYTVNIIKTFKVTKSLL